jgi:hypothetical protein
MNNTSKLLLILLFAACALAAPADEGTVYGAGLGDEAEAVKIGDLLSKPESYLGKKIRVAGKITDVCPKAGCWIEIEGEASSHIRFKVKDGEIVFPVDAKGKPVTAEGVLKRIELDREAAVGWMRHMAEERGEAFDPATVTGPMTIYEIAGEGAIVR